MLGAVCVNEKYHRKELVFEEILLDETQIQGEIYVFKEALCKAGGLNYRLRAKRNYELLIRISREYTILQLSEDEWEEEWSASKQQDGSWLTLDSETDADEGDIGGEDEIAVYCYLTGRYKDELLSLGRFDDAVCRAVIPGGEKAVRYLEQMLLRSGSYYDIYDCTQPILIYRGDDLCYRVLDLFAENLGRALEELGQRVEYYDVSERQIGELAGYVSRRFKAVIGMQTYMFSVKWQEGYRKSGFVHDSMDAPKYHFVFDHPILVRDHLTQIPNRTCVLTPDGNYSEFIRNYYGHKARFLPPAGSEMLCRDAERDYEVVFLGSCGKDLIGELKAVRYFDRERCHFLNRYILYMRKDLAGTPESAFQKALAYYGITCTKEDFLEMFHSERWVIYYLADYYRNKTIKTLLNAGLTLHVFGDSWKRWPKRDEPNLVRHQAVMGKDALEVYARAKVSLNIMTWHKDGFTERIANAMLQKSAVVTDSTAYLEKNFVDGEELLLFDLGRLDELPGRIKELLAKEQKRSGIAQRGYEKALRQHTWHQRAEKILEWIEEDKE